MFVDQTVDVTRNDKIIRGKVVERLPQNRLKIQPLSGGEQDQFEVNASHCTVRDGEMTDRLAMAIMGMTFTALLGYWASKECLTGPAPTDPKERRKFHAEGKQPNSVKIHGKWVGYNRWLGEMVPAAGAVASWFDKTNKGQPTGDRVIGTAEAFGRAFLNESMLMGINDLTKAMSDDHYVAQYGANLASGLIPGSATLRGLRGATDPYERNASKFTDQIKNVLPGLSRQLPKRYDAFGRPSLISKTGTPVWDSLTGLTSSPSTAGKDPVMDELIRLDSVPSAANVAFKLGGKPHKFTGKDAEQYQQMAGEALHEALQGLMSNDSYQQADDETKLNMIREITTLVRREARIGELTKLIGAKK
jgi:hypothetical protein